MPTFNGALRFIKLKSIDKNFHNLFVFRKLLSKSVELLPHFFYLAVGDRGGLVGTFPEVK